MSQPYEEDYPGAEIVPLRPDMTVPEHEHTEHGGTEHGTDVESTEAYPAVPDGVPESMGTSTDEPPLEGTVLPRYKQPIQRRPVMAPWVVDREERRHATRWAAGHVSYGARFHAVRVPWYLGKAMVYAPRGAYRVVRRVHGWVFDTEHAPLRQHTIQKNDIESHLKLIKERNERVRLRLMTLGLAAAGAGITLIAGSLLVTGFWYWLGAGLFIACVVFGRPIDRPFLDNATISSPMPQRLTADIVIQALGALGIAEVNKALGKNGAGITFASPIHRDGPGWRADVDLPPGVTPGDVMEKRDRLASGLRRPLGAVWPEPDHTVHAGRMVLWVGDNDMNRAQQAPWPLLRRGKTSVFDPLPFGTDPRGRNVDLPVMYTNLLIGALPGAGKTFSLRVPLLGAALDPTCELRVFELKGSGDLSSLAKVSHRYASGPADDDTLDACMDSLREMKAEVQRRAKAISELPKDIAPESKVTQEIAAKRSLRMHPIVFAIDEVQNLFLDRERGKEAAKLAVFLIKIGRAFGVLLWLATQRPDKDSLPTGVTANIGTRFCLRVMSHIENDMILGTSAHQNGIKATMFTVHDLGIGYLVGARAEAVITHTYNIKGDEAEKVTDRAYALRKAAGTLTGYAIGDAPEPGSSQLSLAEDIASIWPDGEEKVWSERLLANLAELRPDVYGAWDPKVFANQMRERYRIRTEQVWGKTDEGKGANRWGLTRKQLDEAFDREQEV